MPEPLLDALNQLRTLILDDAALVRALASGRRKGRAPRWRRVEMRYVDLKAGRRLQITSYDETQAHVANYVDPAAALDELLAESFGSWHVETLTHTYQVRVSKKGDALVHVRETPIAGKLERAHDRAKRRRLTDGDPVLVALGISDADGRVKPTRQAKLRQIEAFLHALSAGVDETLATGRLHRPTAAKPWEVVDLGCGNAYLTFAAHGWLTREWGPARLVGVDVKRQSLEHNQAVAERLGVGEEVSFVQASIVDAEPPVRPDIVLALHACDTATDDALARAVGWEAPLVLAAPCCHHDISAQLRASPSPYGYQMLTRDGILRERLADTLTDGLRAAILRLLGYRVEVVEFVESRHTPRNTLLRAVRTGAAPSARVREEYAELVERWQLHPRLAELLDAQLAAVAK
ncbi:MAG: SAM-dependent methyltransferase [Actinomycetota bacterium]|nr:SAM-dependent methyltransferase [Actinomycetota bacterium]